MDSKQFFPSKMVAVLGAGKFGTAVANLVAPNAKCVWLYDYKAERALASQMNRTSSGQPLAANVVVTNDLAMALHTCFVVFPVVPAAKFRGLMRQIASDLSTDHILIHGTKGLDFSQDGVLLPNRGVTTMSEVILQETVVRQIGCLAGPNLSTELVKKHPAVTVVASTTPEVLSVGSALLTSDWFRVYTSQDLLSVEIGSVLKNIFAIGSGIIGGMGYQANTYAFFITKAISEMSSIMDTMGIGKCALLGPAGLGDLLATCGSVASRNYTIGYRLAQGERLTDILTTTKEVSEGVQTVKAIYHLMQSYGRKVAITETIYRMLFEEFSLKQGLDGLLGL